MKAWKAARLRSVQGATVRAAASASAAARGSDDRSRSRTSQRATIGTRYSDSSRVRVASPHSAPATAAVRHERAASAASVRSIAHHSRSRYRVSDQ
jgi:hypothetical protein